ncbi:hypothetical protein Pelo_3806 [Pelomyxa schiedti]|nr:hypothetical protein Pelo_3806 [Pelomyxa schiedti]
MLTMESAEDAINWICSYPQKIQFRNSQTQLVFDDLGSPFEQLSSPTPNVYRQLLTSPLRCKIPTCSDLSMDLPNVFVPSVVNLLALKPLSVTIGSLVDRVFYLCQRHCKWLSDLRYRRNLTFEDTTRFRPDFQLTLDNTVYFKGEEKPSEHESSEATGPAYNIHMLGNICRFLATVVSLNLVVHSDPIERVVKDTNEFCSRKVVTDEQDIKHLMHDVLMALRFLHSIGVAHRDWILIDLEYSANFGTPFTWEKPSYMPPEIVSGRSCYRRLHAGPCSAKST